MIFSPVDGIAGAWVLDPEPQVDDRGSFSRTYDRGAWIAHGLDTTLDHIATSSNVHTGTLRGLHLQSAPHGEAKTVRCTRGRVFDVMVDARIGTEGFGRWAGFELDVAGGRSLHLPVGVAHGFITREANSELTYLISAAYEPAATGGFRWDDPDLAIAWPLAPEHLSDRDQHLPGLADWAAAQEHR